MEPNILELVPRITDNLPVGVWVGKVPGGELSYANATFAEIMRFPALNSQQAGDFSEPYGIFGLDGQTYPEDKLPFSIVIQTGQPVTVDDIVLRHGDGTSTHVRAWGKPLRDEQGQVTHVMVVFADVTAERLAQQALAKAQRELKAALDLTKLHSQEIHHRVKNNLQVITSLLSLQESASPQSDVQEILLACRTRIGTIAAIHEMLYSNVDTADIRFDVFVGQLLAQLQAAYGTDAKVTIHADLPATALDLDTAIGCGLIVNELVTNAFKHAFEGGSGEIHVSLTTEQGTHTLTVSDTGTQMTIPETTASGLGMRLVRALAGQLGGTLEISSTSTGGAQFQIRWTATETASSQ